MYSTALYTLCIVILIPISQSFIFKEQSWPLVNLDYAIHRPTYVNTTSLGLNISVYKNIRFAQPPVGELRFRKPKPITLRSTTVQDGNQPADETACIASAPSYLPYPDINGTTIGREDCLFLDVYVPDGVKPGDDVPVIHWIFGGAYAFGSKDVLFSPLGLFDAAKLSGHKFIFVANNYRLGMPGFTSAPGEDLDVNVGLHDCIAAVEWTRRYISRFGGCADRVTVMGESAGAGMINLMITGKDRKGKLPFQQAFISSPGIPPRLNTTTRRKALLEEVLKAANCTNVWCLKNVPEETVIKANRYLINELPSLGGGGNFGPGIGFSPVVDGVYLPHLPWKLLQEGMYHKELKSLMIGTMANEGSTVSSDRNMPQAFPELARRFIPKATNHTMSYIQSLYRYTTNLPEKLAWDWTSDVVFACNAYFLSKALKEKTKRYIMSIPPAIHGQDMSYFFFVNNETTPVQSVAQARRFQTYLLKFAAGDNLEDWPKYGDDANLLNMTNRNFETSNLDSQQAERCEILSRVFSDPTNGA